MALKPTVNGLLSRNPGAGGTIPSNWWTSLAGTCIDVTWAGLQSTRNGAIGGAGKTAIDNELAWLASSMPQGKLRIRLRCGIDAPAWLGTQLGTVIFCDSNALVNNPGIYWDKNTTYTAIGNTVVSNVDGNYYKLKTGTTVPFTSSTDPSADSTHWTLKTLTNPQAGDCPIWWSTTRDNNTTANPYNGNLTTGWTYVDYYHDFMDKMAAIYDSNAFVADIVVSPTTTIFAEQFGHHVTKANQANPTGINMLNFSSARGLGGSSDYCTRQKEMATWQGCVDAAKAAWSTTRLYIAILAYDYAVGTTMNQAGTCTLSGSPQTITVVTTNGQSGNTAQSFPPGSSTSTAIADPGGANIVINYTGLSGTTLTGCTGSGVIPHNAAIVSGAQDLIFTWEATHYFASALGDQAVLGNNGFEEDANGTFSVPLIQVTSAYAGPISYQTRTANQLADLSVNIFQGALFGASTIELPDQKTAGDQGYQSWLPGDARIVAGIAALAYNPQPRRFTGVPPQKLLGIS